MPSLQLTVPGMSALDAGHLATEGTTGEREAADRAARVGASNGDVDR